MNVDYIPRGLEEQYSRERAGRLLESLIPQGKATEYFMDSLKTKFKSVRILVILETLIISCT